MQKLKLALESLAVESFDTTAVTKQKGTVMAEQCSCGGTCDFQATCAYTCDDVTCPNCPTCAASCNGTCNCSNNSCGSTCDASCYGTCGIDATCYDTCNGACGTGWTCTGPSAEQICNDG